MTDAIDTTELRALLDKATVNHLPALLDTLDRYREALQRLSDAADEVNGEIDRQTYKEKAREEFDIHPDHEFAVVLPNRMLSVLNEAICAAQSFLAVRGKS